MKNALLVAFGFLSLSIGVVGIFFPVLPTTPFVLVSAGCFLKGSTRLYRWLTGHRTLGPYIDNWCRYRAVTKKSKIVSIVVLWAVLSSTVAFGSFPVWMRFGLVFVGIAVTVHLALLKTLTAEMMQDCNSKECEHGKKVDK